MSEAQEIESPPAHRLRTIWISDVHLGTRACRADLLLDFLRHHEADTLYLVGDIVDGWQLKKSWYWPQAHNDVVQKILRKARKGTRVVYITGNHDEAARLFKGMLFGGVLFARHAIHQTLCGRKLWVTHGDQFDRAVRYSRLLAWLGGWAYDMASALSLPIGRLGRALSLPHWSLAAWMKRQSRQVDAYVAAYERAAVIEARRRGVDGIVCGHIHTAAVKTIDGLLYFNDGDWVENFSALVERLDGSFELLRWTAPAPVSVSLAAPTVPFRPLLPEGALL